MNIHIVFMYLLFAMTYLSNVKQKPQPLMCKMYFVCSCLIKYDYFSCLLLYNVDMNMSGDYI